MLAGVEVRVMQVQLVVQTRPLRQRHPARHKNHQRTGGQHQQQLQLSGILHLSQRTTRGLSMNSPVARSS